MCVCVHAHTALRATRPGLDYSALSSDRGTNQTNPAVEEWSFKEPLIYSWVVLRSVQSLERILNTAMQL